MCFDVLLYICLMYLFYEKIVLYYFALSISAFQMFETICLVHKLISLNEMPCHNAFSLRIR